MTLNSDDFGRSALEAVKKELRGGLWPVWKRCDLMPAREGSKIGQYIFAPPVFRPGHLRDSLGPVELVRNELLSTYRPLVDDNGLFLEFARLADNEGLDAELGTDKNAAVALAWAETYGVLGLTPVRGAYSGQKIEPIFDLFHGGGEKLSIIDPRIDEGPRIIIADGTAESVFEFAHITTQHTHSRRVDVQGGKGDTVEAFALEAWTANTALHLYQAATADTTQGTETIRHFWKLANSQGAPGGAEALKDWALEWVRGATLSRVRGNSYPWLYKADSREGDFMQGVRFENLLGAMWLQMMWLLTAGNNVRKCRYFDCANVITFEAPEQLEDRGTAKYARKKYKTRVDKEFCSHNCASKDYYHNKKRAREHAHVDTTLTPPGTQ